ncbi:hypothetical protein BD560DRAFT_391930 [Blakeslea trispora]|nr:hypothetical protein BD560DRAFT_391930 [Blakeslea trispora]
MSTRKNCSVKIPYLGQLFKQISKSKWIQLCFAFAVLSAISTISIMIKVLLNTRTISQRHGPMPDEATQMALGERVILKGDKITYENSLFIAFELWRLWCLTDGIVHLNSLTILASAWLSLFSVVFNIFFILEYRKWFAVYDPLKLENMYLQIALTVVSAAFMVPIIISAYKVSKVIGWQVYKKIGSSIELQGMYNVVQWFALMLKIDTFFEIVLMGCATVAAKTIYYRVLGCSMILLLTFALVLARIAITKESRWMMCLFLGIQICLLALNILLLADLLDNSIEMQWFAGIGYVVSSCICIITTLFLSIRCLFNFKKGLKPYVYWMPFKNAKNSIYDRPQSSFGTSLEAKIRDDMPIDDEDSDDSYRSSSDTDYRTLSMLEKNESTVQRIYKTNSFGYSNLSHTSLDRPEILHPVQPSIINKPDTIKIIDQRIVPVASTLPSPTRLALKPVFKSTAAHTVVLPSAPSSDYSSRPMHRDGSYESIPLVPGN